MKRMLCSLVLLFAMSTMGLLVGCTGASTPQTPHVSGTPQASTAPITFTDLRQELDGSRWEGSWEGSWGGEGWNGGPAKLFLRMADNNIVYVQISIYESSDGDYKYWAHGTTNGNTMELTRKGRSKIVFSLSKENGVLVLRGDYEVTGGFYAGETGSHYYKKKG